MCQAADAAAGGAAAAQAAGAAAAAAAADGAEEEQGEAAAAAGGAPPDAPLQQQRQQQQRRFAGGAATAAAQPPRAEAPPLSPPAAAALGFGAAWVALRAGVEAAAAAAREAELWRLLAQVTALGGAAPQAAQRFSACFCSVLLPAQQAQHLSRLRAELAPGGGGPQGVLTWLHHTLDALGMQER